MSVDRTNITITNGNSQIYRLTVPSLDFVATEPIIAGSQVTVSVLFSHATNTVAQLQSQSTGQILTFTFNTNGQIILASTGLLISAINAIIISQSPTQRIIITNRNGQTWRLTAPSLNFVAKALITANSQFSLALPYSQSQITLYQLQSQGTNLILTFTLSINGPISRVDPGLQMTDIITGTSGSQDWESSGEIDAIFGNGLILLKSVG